MPVGLNQIVGIRASQSGILKDRTSCVGSIQVRAGEVRTGAGPALGFVAEEKTRETRIREVGPAQVRAAKVNAGPAISTKVRTVFRELCDWQCL